MEVELKPTLLKIMLIYLYIKTLLKDHTQIKAIILLKILLSAISE